MSVLAEHTVLPPALSRREEFRALAATLGGNGDLSLTTPDGTRIPLSGELRDVMAHALAALGDGQAVTVEPHRTVLSTQEAADMLGISRPTVVKLLESGEIPFSKPGRHRRVQLQDLLDYQSRVRVRRREELKAMSREAADDDAYRSIDGFSPTR